MAAAKDKELVAMRRIKSILTDPELTQSQRTRIMSWAIDAAREEAQKELGLLKQARPTNGAADVAVVAAQ